MIQGVSQVLFIHFHSGLKIFSDHSGQVINPITPYMAVMVYKAAKLLRKKQLVSMVGFFGGVS